MNSKNPNNPNRLKILALIRKDPAISISEIIRVTRLSRTAIRYHMINLAREGAIKGCQKVSSEKLTEYAKLGRGTNAFVPRKAKKNDKLQERIDMVVAKALGNQTSTQHDVIRHVNAPLRLTKSHKVG